jgi:hypothetical protein
MLDIETLFDTLIRRDATSAQFIGSEYDTTLVDKFPAIVWLVSGTGNQSNGPGLYTASLTAYVHGEPAEAWACMSELYDAVWSWDTPGNGTVDGIGSVQKVTEDINYPSRDSTSIVGGSTGVQYQAIWGLLLRQL